MGKEKRIRIAFDDTWDIIYGINYKITENRPYIETIRTIIYVIKDDNISKVIIL